MELEESKTESFEQAFNAYMQDGRALVFKLQQKTANSGSIAVLIPAFMENKTLLWSLMDIDLVSIP